MKNLMFKKNRPVWAVAALLCFHSIGHFGHLVAAPVEFRIGKDGSASKVTLSASLKDDAEAQKLAEDLRLLLAKITGETGAAEAEEEGEGIHLSVAADLPELATQSQLNTQDILRREDYLMRSSGKQLLIVGATPQALPHAVADLLYRWGYRRFFAGAAWEIVPRAETLRVAVDEVQRPAFTIRDIWYAGESSLDEKERYAGWRQWNRMGSGFRLNTRHAYGQIYRRNKALIDAHPEYFAERDGKRDTAFLKFNAANKELLDLLVADGKAQLAAHPDEDSISMEPSDLEGWDNTGEASKTIGSPSNQAVTMANVVAREAAKSGKYVGMYAYYEHQHPPTIPVEPNVIISFATRLLKPDRDVFESIALWREQGVKLLGIRDYTSVFYWDLAMPGRALGGNIDYLASSLPKYHKEGARFYTSEAMSSWGGYGLGYYIASRLLWNTEEKPSEVVADFLDKSFGKAAAPMARFYSLMNGEDSVWVRKVPASDLYTLLLQAWDLAEDDEAVCTRLGELIAYVRYVELINAIEEATLEKKSDALRTVSEWVLRMAPMQMLPTDTIVKSRYGFRNERLYAAYNPPNKRETAAMIKAAEANPVKQEELLALARSGSKPVLSKELQTGLLSKKQGVSSPWLRHAASFVFPLSAGDTLEASLVTRHFGFSFPPRYVVMDPHRKVIARGRLSGESTTVEVPVKTGGEYALIVESSPNLVKCTSPRSFFLTPDNGLLDVVSYVGSLHFSVPAGAEAQFVVGGQRKNERINLMVAADDGEILADERSVNGYEAHRVDLSKRAEARSYEVKITKPDEGYFEDAFIKFQGGLPSPIGLLPEAYGPAKAVK